MILTKVAITAALLFMAVAMTFTALDDEWAETFKRFDWVDKTIVGCAMAGVVSALAAFLFFVWGI
jgi:hypothetical protein